MKIYFAKENDIEIINYILKNFNTRLSESEFNENPFNKYLIIKEEEIIGLLVYSVKYEQAEIEYLYINEKYRNKGYSKRLLDFMFTDLKRKSVEIVTLEVKKSNIKAINLYKKYFFKEVAIRKKYYKNEDGLLMVRKLM